MKLGTDDISKVYHGTDEVTKIYKGATEIWSGVSDPIQTLVDEYKAYVTGEGGTVADEDSVYDEFKYIYDNDLDDKIALLINYDDFGRIEAGTNAKKPVFIITFDDGVASEFTDWFSKFNDSGVYGTSFIVSDYIETGRSPETYGPNLTWDQILQMRNAGWDIQCHSHTHPDLTGLTKNELVQQYSSLDDTFNTNGIAKPTIHAYPGGLNSGFVHRWMCRAGRLVGRGVVSSLYTDDWDSINIFDIRPMTDSSWSQDAINDVIANNRPLVVYFHGVTYDAALQSKIDSILNDDDAVFMTMQEFAKYLHGVRGYAFPLVYSDLYLQGLFSFGFKKTKRIIFDDKLSVITSEIANNYKTNGYDVAFLNDTTDDAFKYAVPNDSFRNVLRTYLGAGQSGLFTISIGSGSYSNIAGLIPLSIYENGYTLRMLPTRRFILYRVVSGATTSKGDVTPSSGIISKHDSFNKVELKITGGYVKVIVNDTEIISVSDATYTSGNVLLMAGALSFRNKSSATITTYKDSIFTGDLQDLGYDVMDDFNKDGFIIQSNTDIIIKSGVLDECVGLKRAGDISSVEITYEMQYATVKSVTDMLYVERSIAYLDYSGRSISGDVSDCGLHYFKNTLRIILTNNSLTGTIPSELYELIRTERILLNQNAITGYEEGALRNKPRLNYIDLSDNALTESAVNQILIDVRNNVAQNLMTGTLYLSGGTNAIPSGDGAAALYDLQNAISELGARGDWTVTVNS